MFALWSELTPLILVSAALPLQTVVTLALVRSSLRAAYAWVAGMVMVRMLQGLLFGVVLAPGEADLNSEPRYFLGALLLVLSLLLYAKALRTAFGAEDEDAPPPEWLSKAGTMSPLAAFGAGAGFMTLSVKFLVFTLAAISAITYAHIGTKLSLLTFLLFVLLAHTAPFGILALATSSSARSTAILQALRSWLTSNSRIITIIFAVIFGTWFLLKALTRLGVI